MDEFITFVDGTRIHRTAIIGHQPMQSPALGRATRGWVAPIIGADCRIGPYAVIYAGTVIGSDCLIGEHAVVREGSRIGDRCLIGQGVHVAYEVTLGDDVRIIQGSHIGGLCRIGSGTFIAPAAQLGSNMRRVDIDNQVFDPRDAAPSVIGERVMIGAGANILAGVMIGDRAVIAASALVVKDVPAGFLAKGLPARAVDLHAIARAEGTA